MSAIGFMLFSFIAIVAWLDGQSDIVPEWLKGPMVVGWLIGVFLMLLAVAQLLWRNLP